ncbi:AAA family ATPase [Nocardia asteroides]|uniref:ParA family protein n=1 Tax=Nocardia asteroides TaxID=1824 RepID=UPI00344A8A60
MSSTRVVAVANQKGGVGKTTTTLCCARSARIHYGARVLVVDMDPSGNATTTLVADPLPADSISLADALAPSANVPIGEVIVPSIWDGVDLAPGGPTLTTADQQVGALQFGREHRLRDVLKPVLDSYDLVLIDNPPTLLGMLLVNSLTAADAAVLVTEADRWSADGLALLGRTLAGVRDYHNPRLEIVGTIVNKWRNTANEQRTAADLVEGMGTHFPGVPVWMEHLIPLTVGIKDSLDAGLGLDQGNAKLRVLSDDYYRPITGTILGRTAA